MMQGGDSTGKKADQPKDIKGEFAIQENKKINEGIFEDINE